MYLLRKLFRHQSAGITKDCEQVRKLIYTILFSNVARGTYINDVTQLGENGGHTFETL